MVSFLERVDAEVILKEVGVEHDGQESDRASRKVQSVGDGVREDLRKVPVVGFLRGKDAI